MSREQELTTSVMSKLAVIAIKVKQIAQCGAGLDSMAYIKAAANSILDGSDCQELLALTKDDPDKRAAISRSFRKKIEEVGAS